MQAPTKIITLRNNLQKEVSDLSKQIKNFRLRHPIIMNHVYEQKNAIKQKMFKCMDSSFQIDKSKEYQKKLLQFSVLNYICHEDELERSVNNAVIGLDVFIEKIMEDSNNINISDICSDVENALFLAIIISKIKHLTTVNEDSIFKEMDNLLKAE